MFCPKCGSKLENTTLCANCSFDVDSISNVTQPSEVKTISQVESDNTQNTPSQESTTIIKKIIFGILGVAVAFMFFSAASSISEGGLGIMSIQSVGGKTLEEAYYYELGSIYEGFATALRGLGISLASILVWLGFKK